MFLITTLYVNVFIFTIILHSISSTISPRYRNKENIDIRSGPQTENVFRRKLIQKDPSIKDIIRENNGYFENTGLRNFNGKIMGFVTLSNNDGYDVSRNLAKKFDIIAPNSYAISRLGSTNYILYKFETIDDNWINDINKPLYPAFQLYKFTADDYLKLFSFYSERKALNKLIVKTCRENKFNGIVFEMHLGYTKLYFEHNLYNLVVILSNDLKAEGVNIILSIPPPEEKNTYFTSQNFERLYSHVEYFAFKTYEYLTVKKYGPIAPLPWIRKSVEYMVPSTVDNYKLKRKKILMGINLFGYIYRPNIGHEIINGEDFVNVIKYLKNQFIFDDINIEHSLNISKLDGSTHIIYFPTLYTINERIKLAEELGVGLLLVDVSLGLNYFYDLF